MSEGEAVRPNSSWLIFFHLSPIETCAFLKPCSADSRLMIVGGEAKPRFDELVKLFERAGKEAHLSVEDVKALNEVIDDWKSLGADRLYRFAGFDVWNFPLYLSMVSAIQNRRELISLRNQLARMQTVQVQE